MALQEPPTLWRQILRQNFTRWDKLADFLELDAEQRKMILSKPTFALNLPMRLAQKIEKKTLNDPILRQFLPTIEEEYQVTGFKKDPIGDIEFRKTPKLLHKYQNRVLLVCTSACAMHCRYCFRQHFEYDGADNTFKEELQVIAEDNSLHEVILSGGDPLSLSDNILQKLLTSLSAIPHVSRIRFHTRYPIGIPERIDDSLLNILKENSCQIWFVIHANHPRELDDDVLERLRCIQRLGIVILNQAVLLRGVNDDLATLKSLCERLVDHGIMPYYLHQLDQVQGGAHFEVSEKEGLHLHKMLTQELSGYAVPRYVKEIAGEQSKTTLGAGQK